MKHLSGTLIIKGFKSSIISIDYFSFQGSILVLLVFVLILVGASLFRADLSRVDDDRCNSGEKIGKYEHSRKRPL